MAGQTQITEEILLIIGTLGMMILAFAVVFFIYLYQRKLIKKTKENQEIKDLLQEEEIKSAYALLEGQDQERKRIAQELHDNLGSILVTLNMYADALIQQPQKAKEIASKISETSKLANEETRKISHSLDSGLLHHFGLKTAILQLSQAIEAARHIQISTQLDLEEKLDTKSSLEVYRIVQELINNSLKHAHCTKIDLEISQISGSISLIYQDNGVGFKPESQVSGMGLRNIHSRVERLNGNLTIDSKPQQGSTFIIEIAEL